MTESPFKPLVQLPANLTVRFGAEALTTADPKGWCQRRAAELLGEQAAARDVRRLAGSLQEYLEHFRSEMPLIVAAVCFYPDFATVPPRCMVKVEAFSGEPAETALTMDKVRAFYATPDEMSYGETQLTETELPSGPAIRVHRHRKAEPGKHRSKIAEEILWLVWPPGWTFTVVMSTRWIQPAFREAAAVIADEIAGNFRIEPAS